MDAQIYYVTRRSRWFPEGGFNLLAIKKYGIHKVTEITPEEAPEISDSIIFFENVQQTSATSPNHRHRLYRLLNKFRRPDIVHRLKEKGNIVIGGVAGPIGFEQYSPIIPQFHLIRCNIDSQLQAKVKAIHRHVHVIATGEDPELFKPSEKPDEIILSWAGRDHKRFKRADILEKLGYPYVKATYFNNYISHEDMPQFLNSSSVHIVTSEAEGCGRMIIEASLCGLPVISSDVGISRYILDDEWIVPSITVNEYKKRIIPAFEDRDNIGWKNRDRASRFTWRYIVGLYDKLWDEALSMKEKQV